MNAIMEKFNSYSKDMVRQNAYREDENEDEDEEETEEDLTLAQDVVDVPSSHKLPEEKDDGLELKDIASKHKVAFDQVPAAKSGEENLDPEYNANNYWKKPELDHDFDALLKDYE